MKLSNLFSLLKNRSRALTSIALLALFGALAGCQSKPVAVDPLVSQNQDLMDEIAQIEAEKNALSNRVQQLEQCIEAMKAGSSDCE